MAKERKKRPGKGNGTSVPKSEGTLDRPVNNGAGMPEIPSSSATTPLSLPAVPNLEEAARMTAEIKAKMPTEADLTRFQIWGHALAYLRATLVRVPGCEQLREHVDKAFRGEQYSDEDKKDIAGLLQSAGVRIKAADDVCALLSGRNIEVTPGTLVGKLEAILEQNVEARGISNDQRKNLAIKFFTNILKRQRDPTLHYDANPTPEQSRAVFEFYQQRYLMPATASLFSRFSKSKITVDQLDEELAKIIYETNEPELMKRFFGREYEQSLRMQELELIPQQVATRILTTLRTGEYLPANATDENKTDARNLYVYLLKVTELSEYFSDTSRGLHYTDDEDNNVKVDAEIAKRLNQPSILAKVMMAVFKDYEDMVRRQTSEQEAQRGLQDRIKQVQAAMGQLYADGLVDVESIYMEARRLRKQENDFAGAADKLRLAKEIVDGASAGIRHAAEYSIVYSELGFTLLRLAGNDKDRILEAVEICRQALAPASVDEKIRQSVSSNLHRAYSTLAGMTRDQKEKKEYLDGAREFRS